MGKYKKVILLATAVIFEVFATTNLKLSEGFTNPWNTVFVVIGMLGGIYFLSKTLIYIPLAITYAVWVGAGTGIVTLIGFIAFDEVLGPVRIVGLILVILGVGSLGFFLKEDQEHQHVPFEREL
ncbi:multidrug transporter EmrE-like cation transporter [Geomicrobium halophilum]|uniref:Multidrug transporter EmrE-like cation transporter n=1 Tax=Geomicrobium halophilum TaxID=549000 RepID=A0A841Q0Z5_9BACL|nr:multidrug efflux SMR transporter [Geomicrobium halophilum]MBB6451155.1 multidrug transporter EmrE-like cation transporter [Geomicrobium halophilum]